MQSKVAAALALIGTASALPQTGGTPPPLSRNVATYDDEPFTPGFFTNNPVGEGNNGVYKGLSYQNFYVYGPSPPFGSDDGVTPASRGQSAAARFLSPQPHSFGTNYTGSPYPAFNFENFNFGCGANSGSNVSPGPAVPCQITVTGYRGPAQVAQNTYNFAVSNPSAQQSERVNLGPDYNGITYANFQINAPPPALQGTLLLLDNVTYFLA